MHDHFLFMTTCLAGQHVEVQEKNGSVFSGTFHSTHAENDNGVVLKMAQLINDGTIIKGGKKDAAFAYPIKTLTIMATDLVQVMAKDLPVPGDEYENSHRQGNRRDIVTDSFLSHAYHVDSDKELKPWMLRKGASHAFAPASSCCCICGRTLDRESFGLSIYIFHCGHVAHLQCETQDSVAITNDSMGGCPICLSKKRSSSVRKKMIEARKRNF